MGVISTNKNTVFTLDDYVSDYWVESAPESETEEEARPISVSERNTPRRRSTKVKRKIAPIHPGLIRGSIGARKLRRCENLRELLSAVSVEDICEDCSDMVPCNVTPFTRLFTASHNMTAWNRFIEKSEEDQDAILANGCQARCLISEPSTSAEAESQEMDQRGANWNACSEECFQSISGRLRDLLLHKSMPYDFLRSHEQSLREHFPIYHTGLWAQELHEGFHRLLIHALAQYLNLRSFSKDESDCRLTYVAVKHGQRPRFPAESLADFLQRLKKEPG